MRAPLAASLIVASGLAAGIATRPGSALAQVTGELVDRTVLRVCADPDDLPFSNEAQEGFENRIASLMAKKLGVSVEYTWWPQSIGFVRNTLRAQNCDLIMGVVAADELVQNSNPYYRSTYVMVVRSEDVERLGSLQAPDMATAQFGVIAGTPPADLLVARGFAGRMRGYNLYVDTRVEKPAQDLLGDLQEGDIDVGLLWGPIAGYFIKRDHLPLTMIPLQTDPQARVRMDYRISMGMRQGEPEWKHQINDLIRELKPEIDAILADYGIPRMDDAGRLIDTASEVRAAGSIDAAPTVAEPDGYRMENYRAPVPATLKGATVLTTPELQALIEKEKPVVVDVLPKQRRPKNRPADQVWMEPERQHLPGSAWLPNVGYGEVAPEFEAYFEDGLAELTQSDKTKAIVFYCDQNCWMSWNAAKRAHEELGYSHVYWYPEGVQGWKAAGLPLEKAVERPMPDWPED